MDRRPKTSSITSAFPFSIQQGVLAMFALPLKFFVLLLVLANWILNGCFILLLLRLVLPRFAGPGPARWCAALKPLTDPVYTAIQRWLVAHYKGRLPSSAGWLVLLAGLLVAQHLLFHIASAIA
jgi:hypothetical protein